MTRAGALIGATWCVGTLLVLVSALDYVAAVWPFVPSQVGWRYGAVGLLASYTLTPLLGALLLAWAAAGGGRPAALRALGTLFLAGAIAFAFLIGGFVLDVLQVRRETAPEARSLTELGSLRAGVKLLLTAAGLAWLGVASLRQARRGAGPAADGPELVMGR